MRRWDEKISGEGLELVKSKPTSSSTTNLAGLETASRTSSIAAPGPSHEAADRKTHRSPSPLPAMNNREASRRSELQSDANHVHHKHRHHDSGDRRKEVKDVAAALARASPTHHHAHSHERFHHDRPISRTNIRLELLTGTEPSSADLSIFKRQSALLEHLTHKGTLTVEAVSCAEVLNSDSTGREDRGALRDKGIYWVEVSIQSPGAHEHAQPITLQKQVGKGTEATGDMTSLNIEWTDKKATSMAFKHVDVRAVQLRIELWYMRKSILCCGAGFQTMLGSFATTTNRKPGPVPAAQNVGTGLARKSLSAPDLQNVDALQRRSAPGIARAVPEAQYLPNSLTGLLLRASRTEESTIAVQLEDTPRGKIMIKIGFEPEQNPEAQCQVAHSPVPSSMTATTVTSTTTNTAPPPAP